MTNKLSINIFRLLRHRTRSTSLKKLGQHGMKNVSVLNLKDLNGLIQEAVNNTLSDFGISLSQEDLQKINDRTREEFLRVLNDRDELKASMRTLEGEMENLRENFHLLKTELAVNSRMLHKEESRVVTTENIAISDDGLDSMESALVSRLNQLFMDNPGGEGLKEKALKITMDLISEEREKAVADAKVAQEERIENLKRRINKLNVKLSQTEELLRRAKEERVLDDGGVPSEFKDVQGLSDSESYHEEKSMLLKEIFTLNMDLKKLMAET